MKKIIIVGGGASGITSAIRASQNKENKVLILERNNNCGKKLLMTGNGKCNFYNDNQKINNYHSNNEELIKEIINDNNTNEVLKFFDKMGLAYKTKNGYYYPFSSSSKTVLNVLNKELEKNNVEIINNTLVTNIIKKENHFEIITNNKTFACDKVIIATGSKAAPFTGSDGMGYEFLKKFGHSINKVLPSLVQLQINENYTKEWAGVRTDVNLKLYENDKLIEEEKGELQLTNYGLSGICIFNLSSYISKGLSQNKKESIEINFLPFINGNVLEYLENLNASDKTIEDLLVGILNYKLVNIIIKKSKIDKNKKYNKLTKEEKNKIAKLLTEFNVIITGTNSYEDAQVCLGGLPLTEINLSTMESKKVKGLYITGELIDVNGNCGGYNLTFAWITGLIAGRSI